VTDLQVSLLFALFGAAALIIGMRWLSVATRPRCPDCGRRTITDVEAHVFSDPAPGRSMMRCQNCGGEYVFAGNQWTKRRDWTDEDDIATWEQLDFDELERLSRKRSASPRG
jgi:hypothetical protein